jgi:hypothetical protein
MTGLEDLLRRQLSQTPEPELSVPPGMTATLRRRVHRRRMAIPAVTGLVGLAGAGAAMLAAQERAGRDLHAVLVASPATTPSPAMRQCNVADLIAQGGPKSMVDFRWPSGARLLALQVPAANCPIELTLSSETLDPQDVEAAERKWGANVRLLPYDPNGSLQPVDSAIPSPTPS